MTQKEMKTEAQLTKELREVIEQLYDVLSGTTKEKLLDLMVNISEVVREVRISKEKEQRATKNETIGTRVQYRKLTPTQEKIIEMAKQGIKRNTIAVEVGKSAPSITEFLDRRRIMSSAKIKKMLREHAEQGGEEISNEEWAKETGVYPKTIERFKKEIGKVDRETVRQALEEDSTEMNEGTSSELNERANGEQGEETNSEASAVNRAQTERTKTLTAEQEQALEMGRQGYEQKEIVEAVSRSKAVVSRFLSAKGVFPPSRIKQMLKAYEEQSGEEKSDEDWANDTGVYPETIARFKQEIEKNDGETRALTSEQEQILEMGRQGYEQKEIVASVSKSTAAVSRFLSKKGILPPSKIKQMLKEYVAQGGEEKSDEDWAKETGVYPKTIARFKQEIGKVDKESIRQAIEEANAETNDTDGERMETQALVSKQSIILEMGRQGKSQEEIGQKVGIHATNVGRLLNQMGIRPPLKIKKMLKEEVKQNSERLSDEAWAEKTGVYPETIARFRKEIEEQEKVLLQDKILEMGKQGIAQEEIAEEVGKNKTFVNRFLRARGILSPRNIKQMLKEYQEQGGEEKSDEEWAKETGVYPETIAKFRKELEEAKNREDEKGTQTDSVEEKASRVKNRKLTPEQEQAIEMGRQGYEQNEISRTVSKSQANICIFLNKRGILPASKIRKMLKEYDKQGGAEKSDEEWAQETGVYPETITRFKKEIKEKKSKSSKKVSETANKGVSQPETDRKPEEQAPEIVKESAELKGAEVPTEVPKVEDTDKGTTKPTTDGETKEKVPEIAEAPTEESKEEATRVEKTNTNNLASIFATSLSKAASNRESASAGTEMEDSVAQQSQQQIATPKQETVDVPEVKVERKNPELTKLQNRILEMGRQGRFRRNIAQATGKNSQTIEKFLSERGVLSPQKIKNMMRERAISGEREMSDEEWAKITGVYVDVIRNLKIEVKGKILARAENREERSTGENLAGASTSVGSIEFEEKIGQEQTQLRTTRKQDKITGVTMTRSGRIVVETSSEQDEDFEEAPVRTFQAKAPKSNQSEQELAENLGISVDIMKRIKAQLNRLPAVSAIAKQYKISSDIVKEILNVVEQEQYARTHTVVDYKKKMISVRSLIEMTDDTASDARRKVIKSGIEILEREFSQFLTKQDYALLAYGYVAKLKMEKEGIELGRAKLGLEVPTSQGLLDKIREIQEMASERTKKTDEQSR